MASAMLLSTATKPTDATFAVATLRTAANKREATAAERFYIRQLKAQGPAGYNKLPASPGNSAAYWYLKRRGMLRQGKPAAASAEKHP